MKYVIAIITLFTLLTLGCQEDKGLKTAQNVRVHEIPLFNQDSSEITYWYIFYNGDRFVYTKTPEPLSDFSGVFFVSSKKIPKELKFSEGHIKATSSIGDPWGFEVLELQDDSILDTADILIDPEVAQDTGDTLRDSVAQDVFSVGDTLGMKAWLDSVGSKKLPKILLDYTIDSF